MGFSIGPFWFRTSVTTSVSPFSMKDRSTKFPDATAAGPFATTLVNRMVLPVTVNVPASDCTGPHVARNWSAVALRRTTLCEIWTGDVGRGKRVVPSGKHNQTGWLLRRIRLDRFGSGDLLYGPRALQLRGVGLSVSQCKAADQYRETNDESECIAHVSLLCLQREPIGEGHSLTPEDEASERTGHLPMGVRWNF